MKRATPTPNRFITYTPNWWVNGFLLFAFFFLLDGCVDETLLTGFKKEPKVEVRFKEFNIPAVTVQADSISSQNVRSSSVGDRWLCGKIDNPMDPNFGKSTASIFTRIKPGSKIYSVKRSNYALTKATLNLVLDYYVYGDTLNSESAFSLHEIADASFSTDKNYFTNSIVNFDPTSLATGTYQFKYDSIKKYATLNADNVSTNNIYDTLTFDLPIDYGIAKTLFDTVSSKGLYIKLKKTDGVTDTLVYSTFKTDSVFRKSINGLAIAPQSGNRVLGFTSRAVTTSTSSRLTLYYSYFDSTDNAIKNSAYNYYFQDAGHYQDIPSFSKIDFDRSATNLSGLTLSNKYTNFNAPDGFCYVQSGTGLYSKLDFTAVLDTFSLLDKVIFNSAELIIPVEPTRTHLKAPAGLFLRVASNNYRFFSPPFIPYYDGATASLIPDPIYTSGYYCFYNYNDGYLDVRDDGNSSILSLEYKNDDNDQYYRGYLTQFFEYHLRLPASLPRINYLALVPATYFGKSFNGVSFRNDQVKLRVYYSVPK